MSVEWLREAAALMRERAEAATPGPWHTTPDHPTPGGNAIVWAGQATVAEVNMPIPTEFGLDGAADRDHIASWHPAVALAVADWLDMVADKGATNIRPEWYVLGWDNALAVARAYLGSDQ